MTLARGHSRCRACQAVIRWAKSDKTGKPIPMDPEPVADGNIVVNRLGVAHVLHKGEEATVPTYVSHFATCPKRDQFRRRNPAAATSTGGR